MDVSPGLAAQMYADRVECGFARADQGAAAHRRELLEMVSVPAGARFGHEVLLLLLLLPRRRLAASCLLQYDATWGTCEVGQVCVAADLRGGGLCGRLIRAATERARARGCRALKLYCDAPNEAACACYRRAMGPPVHSTATTHALEKALRGSRAR